MVPCLDISSEPLTKLLVTITGNISGVSPTAVAIENSKALSQLPLVKPLMTKTKGAMIAVIVNNNLEIFLIPTSKLVSLTSLFEISLAKRPKTVCSPVAKTTPTPEPDTIVVP